MTATQKLHPARRLIRAIASLLSLGTAICGAVIVSAAWTLSAKLDGQYKTNLEALGGTINELDRTIAALKMDTTAFNEYLNILREHLGEIGNEVDSLNREADKLSKLAGISAPQILSDSSKILIEVSKMTRQSANDLGSIPKDPLAYQRANLYSSAGSLDSLSNTLNSTSTEIGKSIKEVGSATQNTLTNSKLVLEASSEQIAILQNGSLKRLPTTLEALSLQLQAHLRLIDSSYDLVRQAINPIMALGFALFFIGLRGIFVNSNSGISNSPPV